MCGPDMNQEVLAYLEEGISDQGLENILQGFRTLYPYLSEIAKANHIKDSLDERVIEAYWIGNELLDFVPPQKFYEHITENLPTKKQLKSKEFDYLTKKLTSGARMHHSFHVFNIWQRTGNTADTHTLESMDQCRISWGEIIEINGPTIIVLRRPIILLNQQLILADPVNTKIVRQLQDTNLMDEIKTGDIISIHWGVPCEILSYKQIQNLEKYTELSLVLANKTV